MKKIMIGIILLMFCLKSFLTFSQNEWAPVGAKWTYGTFFGNASDFYSEKDTLFDGINCKKLLFESTPAYYTYMNQMGEVYFRSMNSNHFSLVYDFSKSAGESWICTSPLSDYSFTVFVDSVKEKIIGNDTFKIQYITNEVSNFSLGSYIIKGVGSYCDLLPTPSALDPPYLVKLRCYEDITTNYYSDGFNNFNCDTVISSIENNKFFNNILISPNPATECLLVKSKYDLDICITNVYGDVTIIKKIKVGENQINISILPKGIYFFISYYKTDIFKKVFIKL